MRWGFLGFCCDVVGKIFEGITRVSLPMGMYDMHTYITTSFLCFEWPSMDFLVCD